MMLALHSQWFGIQELSGNQCVTLVDDIPTGEAVFSRALNIIDRMKRGRYIP